MLRASPNTWVAGLALAWFMPLAASAVDVTGTSAGLSWGAASGPVTGYAVQVSRNGGSYREEARVRATSTRVAGAIGETLRVRIAAYDSAGRLGAPSTASDAITFVQGSNPPPPPPTGGDPQGDIDGDGRTDVVVYNRKSGTLSALLVKGAGAREWRALGSPSRPGMVPVGYSDVDGDGQADVLWRNASSGANELWRMSGSSFSAVVLPDAAPTLSVRAFRDFSGDGRADVFFHDARSGSSELWTMNAAGRTGVVPVDSAPTGMRLAAVADVDGDGSPDLVWHDLASGAVEGWRMDGAVALAAFALPNAPAAALAAGAGDIDGDGTDDLAWQVRAKRDRSVRVWFMDGMNAPAQGTAVRLGKKTRVRGLVDVDSDGRAEVVTLGKGGFRAYRVTATGTQNAGGGTDWNSVAIPLNEVPASKRWYFLVLQ